MRAYARQPTVAPPVNVAPMKRSTPSPDAIRFRDGVVELLSAEACEWARRELTFEGWEDCPRPLPRLVRLGRQQLKSLRDHGLRLHVL